MEEIELKVSVSELDYIMRLVIKRPYRECHQLVNKLLQQANAKGAASAPAAPQNKPQKRA